MRSLADALEVTPGYERAVAAALGGQLRAALVEHVRAGRELLDAATADGGRVLIIDSLAPGPARAENPPAPGARHLVGLRRRRGARARRRPAPAANTWVVDQIEQLPAGFTGIAVNRAGRVWHGRHREMRQAPEGGEERVLEERNRRDELIAASERRRPGRARGAARPANQPMPRSPLPMPRASRPTARCATRRAR